MLDVRASNSSEPRIRIPELPGWQRDPAAEEDGPNIRLALSNTEAAGARIVAVMIRDVPDAEPATIFDNFEVGLVEGLEQEGLPTDVTRTAGTLCGLPSETVAISGDDATMGAASTLVVVAGSAATPI